MYSERIRQKQGHVITMQVFNIYTLVFGFSISIVGLKYSRPGLKWSYPSNFKYLHVFTQFVCVKHPYRWIP